MKIKERFIDPFTDFGFKKLFGSEPNKDLLIDFLNELLRDQKQIIDLSYSKNEHLGKTVDYRKAVFDLYCENENGEKFIIELQKVKQQFFKDRSIYYATFPIQGQAPEGKYWNYQLTEVYTIGIMDFTFDNSHPEQFQHSVKLIEEYTKEIFYDKLTFIYLEMPKFDKNESEVHSHFDKWMYLLKNLNNFTEIPTVLQEKIFRKVLNIAEISNLNEEEMKTYEASLKDKRDWKNAMDTVMKEAREKGRKEGRKEGRNEGLEIGEKRLFSTAERLLKRGMSIEEVSEITTLSIDQVKVIADKLKKDKH